VISPNPPDSLYEADLPAGNSKLLGEYRELLSRARAEPRNPQHHLELGRFYLGIGHRSRAYSALRAAKALQPHFIPAYRLLGRLYREDEELESARDTYLQILGFEPGAAEIHLELGKIYRELGDTPRVVAALGDAVRLNPTLADAYELLAEVALEAGEGDRAMGYLNHLKGLTPGNPHIFLLTANAHLKSGHKDRAVLDLKHAIRLTPEASEARLRLAEIYQEGGLPGQTLETLEPLLAQAPPPREALLLASKAHTEAGERDAAEALLVRFQETYPKDPAAPLERARMRRERNDLAGATAAYRQAAELIPDSPDALLELSLLLVEQEHFEEARRQLLELAERFPQNRRAPLELARVEFARGDLSAALAAYARVLELDPHHTVSLRERARIFLHDGRFEDAIADLDMALEIDPSGSSKEADLELVREQRSFRQAFELHGEVVRSLSRSDFQAAQSQLEEIIELVPDNPRWLSDLADVCKIQGDFDSAQKYLEILCNLDEDDNSPRRARAELLYRLDRFDEAGKAFEELVDRSPEDLPSRIRVLRSLRHRLVERTVSPDSFQILEEAYRGHLGERQHQVQTRLELAHLHLGMGSHLFASKIWVSAVESHLQALESATLTELERDFLLRAKLELARLTEDKLALEAAAEEWVNSTADDSEAAYVHLLMLRRLGRPRAGRTQAETYVRRFTTDGRFFDLWFRFLREELDDLPNGETLRIEQLQDFQREAGATPKAPHAAMQLGFAHLHLSSPADRLASLALASAAFKKAADLAPDSPWPWWGGVKTVAAGVEAARGSRASRTRALGAARAALRRFPRDPYLLFELGRLGVEDDEDVLQQKEGRDALRRCLVQGPHPMAQARALLGRLAESHGDRSAAYHHYLKVFEEPDGIEEDLDLLERLRSLGAE
jgi:tetratricopeptide (TPR) repeat protein